MKDGKAKRLSLGADALDLVAARFRALGEPVRLRLLQRLQEGEASVSELAGHIGTTQPNVSKHLKVLQDTGLVERRQEKNSAFYSIADPVVFTLCDLVCSGIRERLTAQVGALGGLSGGGGAGRRPGVGRRT